MKNIIFSLRRLLDPALEGNPFQLMPKESKKQDLGIFALRLRNRLSYRRY